MARRGPIAFRILAGLVGLGVGLLFDFCGKTPTTARAAAQPQAATHGP